MQARAEFTIIEDGKRKDINLPTRNLHISREDAYPVGDLVYIRAGSRIYLSAEVYETTLRHIVED